jgi:hypothetical protein
MMGFIAPYIFTARDYRQYSTIAILHTFQFSITHALGFSAFSSRILATDLSQSHCHFKSHMKSSFHSLIPFFSLFGSCKFRRLDSIQFLCSQAHIPKGWRLETRLFTLDYCFLLPNTSLITTLHGPRKKHDFYCLGSVFTGRYLAIDDFLLHGYASRECVYRVVA